MVFLNLTGWHNILIIFRERHKNSRTTRMPLSIENLVWQFFIIFIDFMNNISPVIFIGALPIATLTEEATKAMFNMSHFPVQASPARHLKFPSDETLEDDVPFVQVATNPNTTHFSATREFNLSEPVIINDIKSVYDMLKSIIGGDLYLCELLNIALVLVGIFDFKHPLQREERRIKHRLIDRLERMKPKLIPFLMNPLNQYRIRATFWAQRQQGKVI